MRRHSLFHLLTLIVTSACHPPVGSSTPLSTASQDKNPLPTWKSEIEAGAGTLADAGLFTGGMVGVINGAFSDRWSLGTLTASSTVQPDSESIFEIGSISKSFTGILLAELVNEGKANLDDQVESYLPQLAGTFAGNATLRQLATHTSGLPSGICGDSAKPECFVPRDYHNPYAQEDWHVILKFLKAYSRPDSGPYPNVYSNVGFELLGAVVTHIDGHDYETMLIERIAAPLGMTSTSVTLNKTQQENFLTGLDVMQRPTEHWDFSSAAAPAGGIRSSIKDMMKFLAANLNPDASPLGAAMTLSQQNGLGWDSDVGAPVVWKNGETGGFANIILINHSSQIGYTQLTNQATAISQQLEVLLSGGSLPPVPNYPLDATVLQSAPGLYRLRGVTDDSGEFQIASSGSHLGIYNDGAWLRLLAASNVDFELYDGVSSIGPMTLTLTQQDSQINGFVLHVPTGDGSTTQDMVCDRVTPLAPP